MERLTERKSNGKIIPKELHGYYADLNCATWCTMYTHGECNECTIMKCLKKLADYEDEEESGVSFWVALLNETLKVEQFHNNKDIVIKTLYAVANFLKNDNTYQIFKDSFYSNDYINGFRFAIKCILNMVDSLKEDGKNETIGDSIDTETKNK